MQIARVSVFCALAGSCAHPARSADGHSAPRTASASSAKSGWELESPAPSPFELEAGDDTEYQVRSLTVQSAADAAVERGVRATVDETFRIALESADTRTQIVRFQWDVVYSTLTVTFSDEKRQHDARNVIKLFATGWDHEIAKLAEADQEAAWADKRDLVRDWIAAALGSPRVAPVLKRLEARGIRAVFTQDTEGAGFEAF